MCDDYRNIRAVMDAQGYFIENIFYAREFSFVSNYFSVCYEVIPEIGPQVMYENFKPVIYQKNNLHGIPLEPVLNATSKLVIQQSQLKDLVLYLYTKIKMSDDTSVATKNYQLVTILEPINIPIFDLITNKVESEFCPTLDIFDKFPCDYYCPIHATIRSPHKYRCASRKSHSIWKWLKLKSSSANYIDYTYNQARVRVIFGDNSDNEDTVF